MPLKTFQNKSCTLLLYTPYFGTFSSLALLVSRLTVEILATKCYTAIVNYIRYLKFVTFL